MAASPARMGRSVEPEKVVAAMASSLADKEASAGRVTLPDSMVEREMPRAVKAWGPERVQVMAQVLGMDPAWRVQIQQSKADSGDLQ